MSVGLALAATVCGFFAGLSAAYYREPFDYMRKDDPLCDDAELIEWSGCRVCRSRMRWFDQNRLVSAGLWMVYSGAAVVLLGLGWWFR